MLAALLISLREVIEATLIVATVVGILSKPKQTSLVKNCLGCKLFFAVIVSIGFLALGSFLFTYNLWS